MTNPGLCVRSDRVSIQRRCEAAIAVMERPKHTGPFISSIDYGSQIDQNYGHITNNFAEMRVEDPESGKLSLIIVEKECDIA